MKLPSMYGAALSAADQIEALRENKVRVAAAVYAEDMYVERAFSEETAGLIRGAQVWLTNEFEHDAVRTSGERVLGRLLDMVQGR